MEKQLFTWKHCDEVGEGDFCFGKVKLVRDIGEYPSGTEFAFALLLYSKATVTFQDESGNDIATFQLTLNISGEESIEKTRTDTLSLTKEFIKRTSEAYWNLNYSDFCDITLMPRNSYSVTRYNNFTGIIRNLQTFNPEDIAKLIDRAQVEEEKRKG